ELDALIELLRVEEAERLEIAQRLRNRLRERVEVEDRLLAGGVVKTDLLGQDRLSRSGWAADQRGRALWQTACKQGVEVAHARQDVSARDLLTHGVLVRRAAMIGG